MFTTVPSFGADDISACSAGGGGGGGGGGGFIVIAWCVPASMLSRNDSSTLSTSYTRKAVLWPSRLASAQMPIRKRAKNESG